MPSTSPLEQSRYAGGLPNTILEQVPQTLKRERTQNACDACRARKIKCRYEGASCVSCNVLGIICRSERPRKRRGPSSKYVEAQKLRDLEEGTSHEFSPSSTVIDPPYAGYPEASKRGKLDALAPSPGESKLDALAPAFVLQQVIHDWFEFVHPVAPILHRDTFLAQLSDQSRNKDPPFVKLVISICAATISALRRRASVYGGLLTVERCYQAYLANERPNSTAMDLTWCLVKYNFSTAIGPERGMDDRTPQILLAEATAGVLHLLHYDADRLFFTEKEYVKRLFWLCYAAQCTLGLHGRPSLLPQVSRDFLEAHKPQVFNDAQLGSVTSGEEAWHGNTTSYIPGLIELSKLFLLWHNSQQGNCQDIDHLKHYVGLAISSLDDLPPELRWRGGLSRPSRANFGTDVQMVNLYITQIHIRSYLLDQMDRQARRANSTDMVEDVMASRQTLVDDMLAIVWQVPEDTLEANGHSLVNKLRDIGLALLNDGSSERSFNNLDRLLAKLERIDVRPGSHDITSPLSHTGLSNLT